MDVDACERAWAALHDAIAGMSGWADARPSVTAGSPGVTASGLPGAQARGVVGYTAAFEPGAAHRPAAAIRSCRANEERTSRDTNCEPGTFELLDGPSGRRGDLVRADVGHRV